MVMGELETVNREPTRSVSSISAPRSAASCRLAMKCSLAAAALGLCFLRSGAAPAQPPDALYDQRQNGTENYRINVDGVMLAIAPAEALLAAASAYDLEELLEIGDFAEGDFVSPAGIVTSTPPRASPAARPGAGPDPKPGGEKRVKRKGMKLRLANFLRPLLKKYRQH